MSSFAAQPDPDDATLIVRVRNRDQHAMTALYDRYAPLVYAVALRVVGDATLAEDILQEVFLQLWRSPAAFDASRGSLAPWLAVVTRHRAIDHMRRRRPEEDIQELVIAGSIDVEREAERELAVRKVRSALAEMPPEQRRAIEMAFFEGLTHTEIAARSGEPLGTVKTRIRSALISLRRRFSSEERP